MIESPKINPCIKWLSQKPEAKHLLFLQLNVYAGFEKRSFEPSKLDFLNCTQTHTHTSLHATLTFEWQGRKMYRLGDVGTNG